MSLQAELIRSMSRMFIRRPRTAALNVVNQRRRMRDYERRVPRPPARTETVEKPLGTIRACRISRPETRAGRHILFLHGGAYVTGSPALYRHISWRFASAARAQFIAIEYRLAPEHPFPAALDDAFAAWTALLGEGANPAHCTIMGDSAGGGLTLGLALKLRDAGGPLPGALVAISPWTDLAVTGPSAYVPLALAFTPMAWAGRGPLSLQFCRPLLYLVFYLAGLGVGARGFENGLLASDGALARGSARWLAGAALAFAVWLGLEGLSLIAHSGQFQLKIAIDIAYAIAATSGCFAALALAL